MNTENYKNTHNNIPEKSKLELELELKIKGIRDFIKDLKEQTNKYKEKNDPDLKRIEDLLFWSEKELEELNNSSK